MMATVAKMLLKKIAVTISFDKNKRNRLLLVLGSIVAGLFLLFLMPIMVLASMGDIELPEVDVDYDEATFMSQLSIEQQENIAAVEADGQAIADAMAARGLQEQTIKAQLIYMSYFDGNRLNDFTAYVEHFAQDDEQLIMSFFLSLIIICGMNIMTASAVDFVNPIYEETESYKKQVEEWNKVATHSPELTELFSNFTNGNVVDMWVKDGNDSGIAYIIYQQHDVLVITLEEKDLVASDIKDYLT